MLSISHTMTPYPFDILISYLFVHSLIISYTFQKVHLICLPPLCHFEVTIQHLIFNTKVLIEPLANLASPWFMYLLYVNLWNALAVCFPFIFGLYLRLHSPYICWIYQPNIWTCNFSIFYLSNLFHTLSSILIVLVPFFKHDHPTFHLQWYLTLCRAYKTNAHIYHFDIFDFLSFHSKQPHWPHLSLQYLEKKKV